MSLVDSNINTNIQQLFDSSQRISINWNNRTLYDYQDGGNQSISWHNRLAYDFNGNETLNWGTQTLFDTSKVQCIIWKNRSLYDVSGSSSVNWGTKYFYGDWSLSGIGSLSSSIANLIVSCSNVTSSGGTITFPLFNNSTASLLEAQANDGILVDTSANLMIGVDAYYRPFLKDPGSESTIGFDPSNSSYVQGETNYGVFKVIGLPASASSEASIALFPSGTDNNSNGYWVIGTNTGNDNGNGNFDFWNGANNVVAKLNSYGNFNISGYLVDSDTSQSIDINNRYLSDQFGTAIIEWSTFNFDNSACGFAFDPVVSGSGLFSVFSTASIIIPCVDTNVCRLSNSDGTLSIDWQNRTLYDVTGINPKLIWSGSNVQIPSDLSITGNIKDTNNIIAIDIQNRILKDGNGDAVLNFQANNSGDTSTPLLLNGNFQGITVNGTINVSQGGSVNADTGSFGLLSANYITGDGSALTNLPSQPPQEWIVVNNNYYANFGDKIQADTRPNGSFTIYTPASASASPGKGFTVSDATSNWATNQITIDGNGNNINGISSPVVYYSNINDTKLEVVFINDSWGYSIK